MKLSSETSTILKNFATINQSLVIRKGSMLVTAPKIVYIHAFAKVAETFPVDAYIYDLHQFLGTLSIMDGADIDFHANSMTLQSGDRSVEYHYAEPTVIPPIPEKPVMADGQHLEFSLADKDLASAIKASSILEAPIISIRGKDNKAILVVEDPNVPLRNTYTQVIGPCTTNFDYQLSVLNLKVLPDTYTVTLLKKGKAGLVRMEGTKKVTYYLALGTLSKV